MNRNVQTEDRTIRIYANTKTSVFGISTAHRDNWRIGVVRNKTEQEIKQYMMSQNQI